MTETGIVSLSAVVGSERLPALFLATPEAGRRFWELFTVNIRNPNTPARLPQSREDLRGLVHGTWIGRPGTGDAHARGRLRRAARPDPLQTHRQAAPGRDPHALRLVGDRPHHADHPAHAVRGPKHSVRKGQTSVLSAEV